MLKSMLDSAIIGLLLLVAFFLSSALLNAFRNHLDSKFRLQRLARHVRRRVEEGSSFDLTINIPSFNEENTIVQTVRSALYAHYAYGDKTVQVIVDGATDSTFERLKDAFLLTEIPYTMQETIPTKRLVSVWKSTVFRELFVYVKENGGKHDALNLGLNVSPASTVYSLNIDADTVLRNDSIMRLSHRLIANPSFAAVAGVVLPAYSDASLKERWLSLLQICEYLASYHVTRSSQSMSKSLMIVSGAFGMFDYARIKGLGGYRKGLGEDMDMTLRLQEDYIVSGTGEVVFEPSAVAVTASVSSVRDLVTQRVRWFKGLLENLMQFRQLFRFSFFGLTFLEYVIVEALMPLLIPLGVIYLGFYPEMAQQRVFYVSLFGIGVLYLLTVWSGLYYETTYRSVRKRTWLFALLLVVSVPLFTYCRYKAILSYQRKEWGEQEKHL